MSNGELDRIFREVSDSIQGQEGRWQFYINEVPFMALTDSTNNRMRIISPITESFNLSDDLKNAALMANFHTALDVKYAISNDVLWSAFIHPMRELNADQVYDAVQQVYSAHITFGTTFSSTSLIFPGASEPQEPAKKETRKRQRF